MIFANINIIKNISYADCERNKEEPCLKVLEFLHLNHQGFSPLFFSLNKQYSTPCEMLAKVWSSTFAKSQSYTSLSIVTFTRGLFSERFAILYHSISCNVININETQYRFVSFNEIGVENHDTRQSISASAEDDERGHDLLQCHGQEEQRRNRSDQDNLGVFPIRIGFHQGNDRLESIRPREGNRESDVRCFA